MGFRKSIKVGPRFVEEEKARKRMTQPAQHLPVSPDYFGRWYGATSARVSEMPEALRDKLTPFLRDGVFSEWKKGARLTEDDLKGYEEIIARLEKEHYENLRNPAKKFERV